MGAGKIIKDCLTGVTGEDFDVGRVAAAATVAAAIGLSIYDVAWQHAHFDLQNYGVGVGTLFAGVGAMLKLKENSEPGSAQERNSDRKDRREEA